MIKSILLKAALAALSLSLIGGFGCILNPSEGGDDDIDDITWPDLKDKEGPIETIRILYDNFKVLTEDQIEAKYGNVLYDDPVDVNDYVWYMSDLDVQKGYPPITSRPEDIDGTIFLLKNSSVMDFFLSGGSWIEAFDICEGCYSTQRTYTFNATVYVPRLADYQEYIAVDYYIRFIVGPHHDDPTKWAIHQATDVGAQ